MTFSIARDRKLVQHTSSFGGDLKHEGGHLLYVAHKSFRLVYPRG